MASVVVELPDEVFSALRRSPDEFTRAMRLAAAIHWYQQGIVSQEKAACIAGLTRSGFLDALAKEKIDVFHVEMTDLDEELRRV